MANIQVSRPINVNSNVHTQTNPYPTDNFSLSPQQQSLNHENHHHHHHQSPPQTNGHNFADLYNKLDPTTLPLDNALNPSLPTPPPSSPNLQLQAKHRAQLAREAQRLINDDALVPVCDKDINTLIKEKIIEAEETGDERAFFVGDLSDVYAAVKKWKKSPLGDRVEIFYAVKCNPSPVVLHLLSLLGTSFDCASVAEINMVLSLPNAPSPDKIIFANPCKPISFIKNAQKNGVEMMTFDNADELYKISRAHPAAKLVLRILTDDSKSLCRLGLKFGAPLATCPGLLSLAKQLGLNVIGVSFHVGSGCKDPMQFADAVWRAKQVFDMGKKEGYKFTFLDVGGGFEAATFDEMSQVLRDALEVYFPEKEGVRVVAEPGRFLVSTAFTLATNVIARRRALEEEGGEEKEEVVKAEGEGADVMYYINDGVYGAFNCIMFDHQIVHPYPLTISHSLTTALPRLPGPPPANIHLPTDLTLTMGYKDTERASVWGPTCDSIDCVRDVVELPRGMEIGDWLGWGEMGAYTMCAASAFNGMPLSSCYFTTGGCGEINREVREILDGFEMV